VKVEMQLHGLDGVLDTLRSLPPEIVSKRGGPVRAALRKAALVIHKQELANLQAVTAHAADADKRQSTGFLAKNVVVTRGNEPRGTKGERYLVRVRRKGYPDRKGARVSTLKTAQLLEYGSSKQPAEPWIRPAFESRKQEALDTVQRELLASIDRIVQKLARQNAGK
jgi:HK97 gp10 family phage protein